MTDKERKTRINEKIGNWWKDELGKSFSNSSLWKDRTDNPEVSTKSLQTRYNEYHHSDSDPKDYTADEFDIYHWLLKSGYQTFRYVYVSPVDKNSYYRKTKNIKGYINLMSWEHCVKKTGFQLEPEDIVDYDFSNSIKLNDDNKTMT